MTKRSWHETYYQPKKNLEDFEVVYNEFGQPKFLYRVNYHINNFVKSISLASSPKAIKNFVEIAVKYIADNKQIIFEDEQQNIFSSSMLQNLIIEDALEKGRELKIKSYESFKNNQRFFQQDRAKQQIFNPKILFDEDDNISAIEINNSLIEGTIRLNILLSDKPLPTRQLFFEDQVSGQIFQDRDLEKMLIKQNRQTLISYKKINESNSISDNSYITSVAQFFNLLYPPTSSLGNINSHSLTPDTKIVNAVAITSKSRLNNQQQSH